MQEKESEKQELIRTDGHKYDPQITPLIIKCMTSVGMTQKKMALELGISNKTLSNWINKYPELRQAYELGLHDDLQVVESSFFRMCMPHLLHETETHYNKDGEVTKIIKKSKEVDPNINALYRYLITRGRDKWSLDALSTSASVNIFIEDKDENL